MHHRNFGSGHTTAVHATVFPGTKSGTPCAHSVKAKAAITWVGVTDGVQAEVRMVDRLFLDAQPDAGGKDFIESLNPDKPEGRQCHRGAIIDASPTRRQVSV